MHSRRIATVQVEISGLIREFSKMRVGPCSFVLIEGSHDVIIEGSSYSAIIDTRTGFIVMTDMEIKKCFQYGSFSITTFKG